MYIHIDLYQIEIRFISILQDSMSTESTKLTQLADYLEEVDAPKDNSGRLLQYSSELFNILTDQVNAINLPKWDFHWNGLTVVWLPLDGPPKWIAIKFNQEKTPHGLGLDSKDLRQLAAGKTPRKVLNKFPQFL